MAPDGNLHQWITDDDLVLFFYSIFGNTELWIAPTKTYADMWV